MPLPRWSRQRRSADMARRRRADDQCVDTLGTEHAYDPSCCPYVVALTADRLGAWDCCCSLSDPTAVQSALRDADEARADSHAVLVRNRDRRPSRLDQRSGRFRAFNRRNRGTPVRGGLAHGTAWFMPGGDHWPLLCLGWASRFGPRGVGLDPTSVHLAAAQGLLEVTPVLVWEVLRSSMILSNGIELRLGRSVASAPVQHGLRDSVQGRQSRGGGAIFVDPRTGTVVAADIGLPGCA